MKKQIPLFLALSIATPAAFAADLVTQIPMEADAFNRFKDKVGGKNLSFYGKHAVENIPGAVGDALRLDGYSSYVEGQIAEFTPSGVSSFSIWVAPETYPIVAHDEPTSEKITVAGTINHTSKSGWAFSVDKNGKYSFDCYAGGWLATAEASDILPCYEWSLLVAINDPVEGKITLYRNGEKVGETKSLGALGNGEGKISIGKTADSSTTPYGLKTFNGLIDEVCVYDGALSENEISATPENMADLAIPAERFEKDLLRPKYHGMPGANWTNESHGMIYSDGKYHVFFQKNANGPFMSRLHWGHISSENLYDWTEEKIALTPGESYDTKGCWSGCVFTDDEVTGGMPNIIYTGVDYQKAYIALAVPTDESLIDWEKKGVIINGKPAGLSDDFRDPYFFRSGDNAYIIVGTAKNGIGATTLHKYNPATKTWSNDGSIFFSGTSAAEHGTFWEMPNITKMENGKWLFTVTPQATSTGVHTLCWVGEIGADGTFIPDTEAYSDLELISQQGYGLLSPTVYQKDGKTILLGIVPDKLPLQDNCNLGWAHLYSFPREISLDENNNLIQKPYSGLAGLHSASGFSASDLQLDGVKEIEGVSGRQFEVKGVFKVGNVPFGFNIFKNQKGQASITYTPADNRLEVNFVKLNRKVNDNNVYNGRYVCLLPEKPEPGSDFTLDVWVDGSIMDIFVNDKYATSIRVYPTDEDANGIEVFADNGNVNVRSLNAWTLDGTSEGGEYGDGDTGIDEIFQELPEYVNVYSINGMLLKNNVRSSDALEGLPKGIYIVNDKKIALR